MQMKGPVRFGIIGCGKITERLALPQLAACAKAEVAALVDTDRAAAERLADRFRIDRRLIWTDWKRMLREAEVEAVAVCLPNHLHAEATVAALGAKKHVLVEKPIATTLAEADAMIAAAKAHERFLMVEQTQRFDPVHEVAHELLANGTLGKVLRLHGRLGHAGPEYWSTTSPWFTEKRQSGGGALIDVGVHILDLLRWLSGKDVKRLCCHAKTLQKSVAVEDNAAVLLEFTDGTMGAFDVSWTTHPYEVTTTWYGQKGQLRTAIGAEHPVRVQLCKADGDPNQPLGEELRPAIPATSRVGGAYPYFAECVLTGTPPFVSGEEGRATLEVILGAYESMRTGGWVDLPLSVRESRAAMGSRPR